MIAMSKPSSLNMFTLYNAPAERRVSAGNCKVVISE